MSAPRILVLDDSPSCSSLIRRALSNDGYTVPTAAEGGPTGLVAAALDGAPDVMTFNVMLPHRDRLEVCRQLRVVAGGVGLGYGPTWRRNRAWQRGRGETTGRYSGRQCREGYVGRQGGSL